MIRKIKGTPKIPILSSLAIQSIPESSNQMPISQSQQVDPLSVCRYYGNTSPKKRKFKWGKFKLGYLYIFPIFIWIFIWIISWFFLRSGFNVIVFFILYIICLITGIIAAIRGHNTYLVYCLQCYTKYRIKAKPLDI